MQEGKYSTWCDVSRQYSLCCCLTAQGQTDCRGSGPFLSESDRHWTHPTLLDRDRQQRSFKHGCHTLHSLLINRNQDSHLTLFADTVDVYTYYCCTYSYYYVHVVKLRIYCMFLCVYRGCSNRQSQADCRLVCCYGEERQEEAPHLTQSQCHTKHWEERRGKVTRGKLIYLVQLSTFQIFVHACINVCFFVYWQAGISSDSARVVSADDEVALLLWEVSRELQVCNQVHHIVVTR